MHSQTHSKLQHISAITMEGEVCVELDCQEKEEELDSGTTTDWHCHARERR